MTDPTDSASPDVRVEGEVVALRRTLGDLLAACRLADAKEDLSTDIDGSLLDAAQEAIEMQWPVIWSPEDVATLQAHQDDPARHPYTCGNDRSDDVHQLQMNEDGAEDAGVLIPTARGWVCPACDYRQFWAHGVARLASPAPEQTDETAALRAERDALREALKQIADGRPQIMGSGIVKQFPLSATASRLIATAALTPESKA